MDIRATLANPEQMPALLTKLGFKHQEYPDGWFWYIMPSVGTAEFVALATALGYDHLDLQCIPDCCAIFQCNDKFEDWQHVIAADNESDDEDTVVAILEALARVADGTFEVK